MTSRLFSSDSLLAEFSHGCEPDYRHFARSRGQRAKNDRLDAGLLAEFGRERRPRAWQPVDANREELRTLHDRRRQLVELRTKESNRLETASSRLAGLLEKSIAFLDTQIAEVEEAVSAPQSPLS